MRRHGTHQRLEQALFELDEEYHVASRNDYTRRIEKRAHLVHYQPKTLQLYEGLDGGTDDTEHTRLGDPRGLVDDEIFRFLASRRSDRDFGRRRVDADRLGRVCYFAAGLRRLATGDAGDLGRTTPSAGGLCSVDVYVLAMGVSGLPKGAYLYRPSLHALSLVRSGDYTAIVRHEAMFQVEFSRASALLVLVSSISRLKAKYGLRGYRLALMDIGYASQNIYLAAAHYGVATCASAGFVDDVLNDLLGLDGLDRAALLVHGLG